MPAMCFEPANFRDPTLRVIEQANDIIEAYQADGYKLTLRQLYYRFVANGWIPNTTKSYNRLGTIISKARLAGFIDWNAIEDRARNLMGFTHLDGPEDAVEAAARRFRIDLWEGQTYRVEVWVEKQALESVVARAANAFDCRYMACKGYMSQSEMWAAAMRFREYEDAGQKSVIIHLGDHDPSGLDMTRDNFDRLNDLFGADVEVDRIALNMPQVRHHKPPPNPAKVTDSRFAKYEREHGSKSWELDALEPKTLVRLIHKAIKDRVELKKYNARRELQENYIAELDDVASHWGQVVGFMSGEEE